MESLETRTFLGELMIQLSIEFFFFSIILIVFWRCHSIKVGFKSEDIREFLHCQIKYAKSLSWTENLNFPPKTIDNLFKFSVQDSDLEYLIWQRKKIPVSSDSKPILICIY